MTTLQIIENRLSLLNLAESLALADSNMKNFDENYSIIMKTTNEKISLLRLASEIRRAGLC